MGGKSDPPPPPDYKGAAEATAAGNLESTKVATTANRADQVNPYGSLTWEEGANADGTPSGKWKQTVALSEVGQTLFDQQNKTSLSMAGMQDDAMADVKAQKGKSWSGGEIPTGGVAIDASSYKKPTAIDASSYKAPTALDASSYTAPNTVDASSYTAPKVLDSSGYKQPKAFDFGSFKGPEMTTAARDYAFTAGGGSGAEVKDKSSYYDASRVGGVGSVYDPTQSTNTATQAILSRLAPELQRQRSSLESQLANQGITRGSEAWNSAIDGAGRQENDAYTQAGLRGIDLGMQQQGQTYSQTMGNRNALTRDQEILFGQQSNVRAQDIQQANINAQASAANADRALRAQDLSVSRTMESEQQRFNQDSINAQLGLKAQGQGFSQQQAINEQLAALQQQEFGQGITNNGQRLATETAEFGQGITNNNQKASLQGQEFSQNTTNNAQRLATEGTQFAQELQGNAQTAALSAQEFNQRRTNRGDALTEYGAEKLEPLNTLNALRTGSQVEAPKFGSYAQQQTTAGPDYLGATGSQYSAELGGVNAKNAQDANLWGGITKALPLMFA